MINKVEGAKEIEEFEINRQLLKKEKKVKKKSVPQQPPAAPPIEIDGVIGPELEKKPRCMQSY